MADKELYFYLENIALTAAQRDTLVNAIKAWGKRDQDQNPRNRMHWRVRLDGQAVIFEAWVDEDNLTLLSLRQRLANLFNVALSQVTGSAASNQYGQVVTLSYQSTARLRVGVFGGVSATYEESQAAATAYLAANTAAWDGARG